MRRQKKNRWWNCVHTDIKKGKIQIGMRGQKTALTGRSLLRRRGFALVRRSLLRRRGFALVRRSLLRRRGFALVRRSLLRRRGFALVRSAIEGGDDYDDDFKTFKVYYGSMGEQCLKYLSDLRNTVAKIKLLDDGTLVPKHEGVGT